MDWAVVTDKYAEDFQNAGGKIYLNFKVIGFDGDESSKYPVIVRGDNKVSINKFFKRIG